MITDNEIINRLKQCIEKSEMSYIELQKITGISKSSLQRYATGVTKKVPIDAIEAVAKAVGVSARYIMGWDNNENNSTNNTDKKRYYVPVLGYVRAGIPVEAVEEILDYEEITEAMARKGDHFGLIIKGDSMEPKFSEGDVVIVRKQEIVNNGDIAVVLVNGDEATVKKFYRSDAGIKLIALNPTYEPFFYTPEEVNSLPVNVIGKVVELRAKFD